MKFREYEAKQIFRDAGIPTPNSELIVSAEEAAEALSRVAEKVVLKAQVDVGGRGKAGGILPATAETVDATAKELFGKLIKGLPVEKVLVEEALEISHEYYISITIDRSKKRPVILFSEEGGVEIETLAKERPEALRRIYVDPSFTTLPDFVVRNVIGTAPKEIGAIVKKLFDVFIKKDAILVEINPLVATPKGIIAADGKVILDDNALARQGISENRDLTEREKEAEKHGFSYVELDGEIGVIGNGAGLTMATLDIIAYYEGKAANFLDVGGGADAERVCHAVKLVSSMPGVKVIVVNLLGGITRCDEVAKGIIEAGVEQKIIVRIAGTNEAEGKRLLEENNYLMLPTMDEAIRAAVEVCR
ncbi:MAG TPA: ADP-forming succinate--CoA ligase subunit beta [Methanocorpusculum sp.]|jgi:succinyl-CoA synthetase beta subunit|nr:ADP-forming succinate--CoA ligase subunit beta [Methanocorpusculum sp.]MEE1136505.1 ADP-forming succinate--CoA ligase subunit beta [Methanocorpusculum sp.]HJJ62103.1 ADP-forming succinate--CoA ligase subunit beta [Methanocorpusculum sp.]HJJ63127.1 ADP-forming succinate--CoA ligase subunit beta [Methanocorpusculum sp.]HJJ82053.1 ADP-forming succinate--CoA ligase subunit beta [Methanocorpusculum sp.]